MNVRLSLWNYIILCMFKNEAKHYRWPNSNAIAPWSSITYRDVIALHLQHEQGLLLFTIGARLQSGQRLLQNWIRPTAKLIFYMYICVCVCRFFFLSIIIHIRSVERKLSFNELAPVSFRVLLRTTGVAMLLASRWKNSAATSVACRCFRL